MSKTMLIVDDDTAARKTYQMLFAPKGIRFKEASNGKDALAILQQGGIDIVFLDLAMPRMSGEELMEEMLKDEKLKKIPILIETAQGSPGPGRDQAVRERFTGKLNFVCFTRPGPLGEIEQALDRFLAS